MSEEAIATPFIPMKSIVFSTDFLESSRLALDFASAFSHHYGARLTIVHAFELPREAAEAEMIGHKPSVSREHALSRLDAFASGVRRLGIKTEIDLRDGDPFAAVLSAAADNKADLLVLGTHGVIQRPAASACRLKCGEDPVVRRMPHVNSRQTRDGRYRP